MDTKNLLLFPGQGSQAVGMGQALAEAFAVARDTLQEADEVLGFSLSNLLSEGPDSELALTANTQPAILTVSVAAFRVAQKEAGLKFEAAMGHSLGEFSALVATGALKFADALRLVRLRGQAMQEAVPSGVGAMAAVLGLELSELETLCAEAGSEKELVAPANENGGGQIVVAGHADAVSRLVGLAKEKKARAIPLKVSAPFHCALMQPAADRLAEALEPIEISPMNAPVISNVDAEANNDPSRVKQLLIDQVTHRVRWEASVRTALRMGLNQGVELGHGKVLAGLVKRISRELPVLSVGSTADIDMLHPGA